MYLVDCHIFHLLWVPKSICLPQLMIVLPPIAHNFHQKVTSQNIPKYPQTQLCFCSLFFPLSEWHWPSFRLVSSTCPAGCQLVTLRLTHHPLQAFSCHWSQSDFSSNWVDLRLGVNRGCETSWHNVGPIPPLCAALLLSWGRWHSWGSGNHVYDEVFLAPLSPPHFQYRKGNDLQPTRAAGP